MKNYFVVSVKKVVSALLVIAFTLVSVEAADVIETDPLYGQIKLIEKVDCAAADPGHGFITNPKSADATRVETILGEKCRVLPNIYDKASTFAFRLGKDKNLQAGKFYLLKMEYPEDKPRTWHIINRGCDTSRGFHTGNTVGDSFKGKYVNNNCESISYPLSGKYKVWKQFFALNERFYDLSYPRNMKKRTSLPKDGFLVFVAQMDKKLAPLSNGAAVKSISLYEVIDPKAAFVKLNLPPEGLPKRHIFWREEMSDGIYSLRSKTDEDKGITDPLRWYRDKVYQMKTLGIDTMSKDLLEFGHNQGWDSSKYGSNAWVNQSSNPQIWTKVVKYLGEEKVNVMPYYEYKGSVGQDKTKSLAIQKRAIRLDGDKNYTHISWLEKSNCDIVDPETFEDVKKILEITITDEKNKANFIGAWFRPRPSHNPISFNEKDLQMFSAEANDNAKVTRENLKDDKALLEKYYKWWFGKRKEYLEKIRDYLRSNVNPEAIVLFTTDASEPGHSLSSAIAGKGQKDGWQFKTCIVTDDMATMEKALDNEYAKKNYIKPVSLQRALDEKMHLEVLKSWCDNWGGWEWNHSVPKNDPENYTDTDGIMLTMTFNRLYTVGIPDAFEAFRTKNGLAIVRHYSLNENEMGMEGKDSPVGYNVSDVEVAGPFCMAAEVRAMANGDPTLLGYLLGNNYNRGFPEYVRNFNTAFLSLPALPSKVLKDASSDPEVIVREITTKENGKYYSVSHIGFKDKKDVEIKLPDGAKVYDAATGKEIAASGTSFKMDFYPCQLKALHLK